MLNLTIQKSAVISDCGMYRYELVRRWSDDKLMGIIMLNPSTADANLDDPTIRKCIGFASNLGYGGIRVVNLFAWRATDPKQLKKVADPVGPENDRYILQAKESCDVMVAAWGNDGKLLGRDTKVKCLLSGPIYCFAKSEKTGQPKHPLYLPYGGELQTFKAVNP